MGRWDRGPQSVQIQIELGPQFVKSIALLADTIAKSTDAAIQAEVDKITQQLKASTDELQTTVEKDKGE